MWRRLRWIVLALVVVLIGGLAALVITQRPSLDDAREQADDTWRELRPAMEERYERLAEALAAVDAAGGGERDVARELNGALDRWKEAVADGTPRDQALAANELEGLGRRLRANVLASARLTAVPEVTGALAAFDGTLPTTELVDAYDAAARAYEDDRGAILARPVVVIFGYDASPVLVVTG